MTVKYVKENNLKTHTAKLDFCLYYRTYFFYETLSFTNRERRVIASLTINIWRIVFQNLNRRNKMVSIYLQVAVLCLLTGK